MDNYLELLELGVNLFVDEFFFFKYILERFVVWKCRVKGFYKCMDDIWNKV